MTERGGCAIGIEHKSGIYGSWDASPCRGRGRVRGLVRRRLGAVSKLSVQKKKPVRRDGDGCAGPSVGENTAVHII